jgi:transposase
MKADIGIKDIATELDCSIWTAERWWKRVKVPPALPGHAHHRWTKKQRDEIVEKVRLYMVRQRNRLSKYAKKHSKTSVCRSR